MLAAEAPGSGEIIGSEGVPAFVRLQWLLHVVAITSSCRGLAVVQEGVPQKAYFFRHFRATHWMSKTHACRLKERKK